MAKSDFVFKLATSQTYIDPTYDPTPAGVAQPAARGVLRAIGDGLAIVARGVMNWTGKQGTMAALEAMSDRELSDIGLSRGDLPRVFDNDFAADHARGRTAY